MSKILAVDPGNEESAYVVYDTDTMAVERFAKINNEDMLNNVIEDAGDCDTMAIEMPACYGMAVGRTVFDTCRWVGIFQQAFGLCHTYLVYRKAPNREEGIESVTMHLCKSTRAKDSNVRQAIIDRYGGVDRGVGGKKCPKCKGKGWCGVGRPVCPVCNGGKWKFPPGPLFGISKDAWSALGVAITFAETYKQ